MELQDENGDDFKAPLLEMPAESDWILYPSYTDKTLIRDVLAHDLWREMGYYAPRWRFVELFIVTNGPILKPETRNPKELRTSVPAISQSQPPLLRAVNRAPKLEFGGGLMPEIVEIPAKPWYEGMPDIDSVWPGISRQGIEWENYQGVYILMEKIKRGKDRLNIKKLKPEHGGEPVISGGYIFKKDRLNKDEGEKGFKTPRGVHFAYEEPKERDITPAQRAYLTNYVSEFESVLFSDGFSDPDHGYRKYVDVDSFVDYHWMTEITRNIDGFWFSQFYYKDRGGKLKMGPIWDMDLSFGNVGYENGYKEGGWRGERIGGPHYRWFKRLFEDPDFLQRYIDRWAELRTNVFAASNVLARVDAMAAQLEEAQARNYKRWTNLGVKVQPNYFVGKTYQEEVDWLKKWISGRLAWIDTQDFPAPIVHYKDTEVPSTNTLLVAKNARCSEVTMAWLVGQVFYTLDGSDPRLPGGTVSPKALEYKQPILLSPSMQMCARVRSEHGLWSAPKVVRGDCGENGK